MSEWTKKYFDEFYLKYFLLNQSEETTEKQARLIERFAEKGSKILDAGCGIGRHSVKLGEKGYSVVGIDFSPLYVEYAKKEAQRKKLNNVSFRVEDVRKISYVNEFDLIINMWSSFGYFDDETNLEVLKRFYRALKNKGKIIIDIENRDYILKYFIRETFREKGDLFILERRRFHPLTSIVTTHRYIIGKSVRKDYLRNIRIYSATEMINLFKLANLKTIEILGDYNGEKFGENSKRIIIIGQKP